MRRRGATVLVTFFSIFFFSFTSIYLSRDAASNHHHDVVSAVADDGFKYYAASTLARNSVVREQDDLLLNPFNSRHVSSVRDSDEDRPVAILIPGWEVLVIASPEIAPDDRFACLFQHNLTSPARFSGVVPSTNRTTFKCVLPERNRRRQPFLSPVLIRSSPEKEGFDEGSAVALLRWKFLAYDSLSTGDDVVLFVKGVNHRSGVNRSPSEFNCVFSGDADAVRTAVTSSVQEVFRCPHPNLTASRRNERIRVSLEIKGQNLVVPSVAYYAPPRGVDNDRPKSLLCASTMVYNAAKFLKEWVMYHSSIGVERFILYDNDSEDDLRRIVADLNRDGYSVEIVHWIWPKTQEAGFSHSAIYARSSCEWMLYIDVDEFVYAPSWTNSSQPSPTMLQSLLPNVLTRPGEHERVGQVSIKCNEFGPSGREAHPEEGVTQGYDCRRRMEQRHKSIVRLEAVDPSLLNVIHHFRVSEKYRTRMVGMGTAVVNHYKYQAWVEFRNKFRRRVSAYVADWTDTANPGSKDRTPGLGFEPVEPAGWPEKFCEVKDERLKVLSERWFSRTTSLGQRMAWQ